VVDMLRAHGRPSPMNQLVVQMGFEIESGKRKPEVGNAQELIKAYKKISQS
jgi:2-dehydropantoate 2-reductase